MLRIMCFVQYSYWHPSLPLFWNWQSLTWTPHKEWILPILEWYKPMSDGYNGTRCGADGWDIALQARRLRVRFPMGLFAFFIDLILPLCYYLGVDSASNGNEYQGYLLGVKAAGAFVWHTTFMCRSSRNLGAWTSLSPLDLQQAWTKFALPLLPLYGYNRPYIWVLKFLIPVLIQMFSAAATCRRRPGLLIIRKEMHFFAKEN
jgi:hypothetical protein